MVTRKAHNQSSQLVLARIAALYGVQTRYRDARGRERQAPDESLFKILVALGAELNGPSALVSAVQVREIEVWSTVLEPVAVAWEGVLPGLILRLPAAAAGSAAAAADLTLTLEDGSSLRGRLRLEPLPVVGEAKPGGRPFVALSLPSGRVKRALGAPASLPPGYHRLCVEVGESVGRALVISAPRRCWEPNGNVGSPSEDHGGAGHGGAGHAWTGHRAASVGASEGRGVDGDLCGRDEDAGVWGGVAAMDVPLRVLAGKLWGMFAPVYALRSTRDWGAGDLAELKALLDWTGEEKGSLVATLPLLATAFGERADPSPYRPVSRLFWNEFFLAPEMAEEWQTCESVRRLANAVETQGRRDALRATDTVDYQAVMALKRPVIEEMARCFFDKAGDARRQDYGDYLRDNPFSRDYAAFRAVDDEVLRTTRTTSLGAEQYHLYCQWQMDRQLAMLSGEGRPGLLFDLPLGVHPRGFDVERWPDLFATSMSAGAPPDMFFANGQEWETPPLDPRKDRRDGYPYLAACLRNLMRHASVLRIDHIMSFHRLFWIPQAMSPKDGAYVSYPAEELYAVLSRESHRHRTAVVGEDLGTVPDGVRASMRRHAVARTWIFLGTLSPRARTIAAPIPSGAVVTLETHDMVPLAGFLHGDDIETRVETGQLGLPGASREKAGRRRLVARLARVFGGDSALDDDPGRAARPILSGSLAYMAQSAGRMVLVNLDDLLLERRPQNVPGTRSERPNWRRKMAIALEELPRPSE